MIDDYDESSGWMFLLVPAHPGFPGQIPQSRKTVVCVCVCVHKLCQKVHAIIRKQLQWPWMSLVISLLQTFSKGIFHIHHVPKLATPLQISWCKIVNTWQIFTKYETFMETIILKEELLPDMRDISEYFIFRQDSVPAHRAKETVDLLSTETPAFIPPTLWPPNGSDLNQVDYKVWLLLQEQVY